MVGIVTIDQFEGPLYLLLQLIEEQKLDITQIALAEVADQYLEQLHREERWDPDVLADFLVIAAKLVLFKSKVLLPTLALTEEEEADSRDLERQLKLLKTYLEASRDVYRLFRRRHVAFARTKLPRHLLPERFTPPPNLHASFLVTIFRDILTSLAPFLPHPKKILEKVASLEEKILYIRKHILERLTTSFQNLVGTAKSKMDVIVSFLAILELVKQRVVTVDQQQLFEDIAIQKKHE